MPTRVAISTYSSTPDDNAQQSTSFSSSNDDRTSTRTSVLNSSTGDVIRHTVSSNIGGTSNNVMNRNVYSNQAFTGRATSTKKSTVSKISENTKEKTSNNTGLIIIFIILGMAAAGGVGYYFYKRRSTSP